MIRRFLQNAARSFGRKYRYDVSYMLDTIDVSRSAGIRLLMFPWIVGHRGPKAAGEVVLGASLASTLDGDCGSCAQLVVDMGLNAGVPPARMRACVEGKADAGDLGLGRDFARAAIDGDPDVDRLADIIRRTYGAEALVAASFAAASGRFYPVFKRGLGHGATCARLRFGEKEELVLNAAE